MKDKKILNKKAITPPVTEELLKEIVGRIVKSFNPEKIILFGSYAYGQPRGDSDIDLFIIMESKDRPSKQIMKLSQILEPRLLPIDIIVRTPEEVKKRLYWVDPFLHEVLEKGRVLYARS